MFPESQHRSELVNGIGRQSLRAVLKIEPLQPFMNEIP